jgi:hypothetical protein
MFQGHVVAIFVAPAAGAPMEARGRVDAVAGAGLTGDRYATDTGTYSGTRIDDALRAVTLIEREAIVAAQTEAGIPLDEGETRRNLVTVGVPLNHLVGQEFTVGPVRMRGVNLSEPCAYLEGLTRVGVRGALIHRGGLRAEILSGGPIGVGDRIVPGVA